MAISNGAPGDGAEVFEFKLNNPGYLGQNCLCFKILKQHSTEVQLKPKLDFLSRDIKILQKNRFGMSP